MTARSIIDDITEFIFVSNKPHRSDIIFLPGGSDPDCRRCMDWAKEPGVADARETAALIRRLAALKAQEPVATGKLRIHAQDGSFYLERSCGEKRVTLVLRELEYEICEE